MTRTSYALTLALLGAVTACTGVDSSSGDATCTAEVCDGVDNDCDGQVDEEALDAPTWFVDADGDGVGGEEVVISCEVPDGYVATSGDCDDTNPEIPSVEYCDGIDNDCNGAVDDDVLDRAFFPDQDGDGFGDYTGASIVDCVPPEGYALAAGDCDDENDAVHPDAVEVCDGIDNDCADGIDDHLELHTYFSDPDGDGYGDLATADVVQACAQPEGWVVLGGDCDGLDASRHPGADEACDGVDNDCNGLIDDEITDAIFYVDNDGDGYGSVESGDPVRSCAVLSGYATNADDCDDTTASRRPSAAEVCNGVDDNCDGAIDEGYEQHTYYVDADGDGVGAWDAGTPVLSCREPAGYALGGSDCDDDDSSRYPGAAEVCDGLDQDCDGVADDGIPTDGSGCTPTATPPEAAVIDTLTIVTQTGTSQYSGTDNNQLWACVNADTCFRLDVPDVDDNRVGERDIYHFENVGIARGDIDRFEIQSINGVDAWRGDCFELHLDGQPTFCYDASTRWFGEEADETQVWSEPLAMNCTRCAPSPITHGPMVGAVDADAIRLLYRTHASIPTTVYLATTPDGSDATAVAYPYPSVTRDYTAYVEIEGLSPSTTYYYAVEAEGETTAFTPVTTGPVAASANTSRFAFGSCTRYWDQPIFDHIAAEGPDYFFMIGDNNYAFSGDAHATEDSVSTLRWEYRQHWAVPERAALFAVTPTMAVWDDHDFVANDSSGGEPGADAVLRAFREYWGNPSFGTPDVQGVFFTWSWGDVDFFMLDDRYYRGSNDTLLGLAQTLWLKAELRASTATFKFLVSGSQFSPFGSSDSWAAFPAATDDLFDFIRDEAIEGVILLSGDVHRSEMGMIARESDGGYDLPELTSSPLANSNSACKVDDLGNPRDPGEVACFDDGPSGVIVDIDTTAADPTVTARIIDVDGNDIATWTIRHSELEF